MWGLEGALLYADADALDHGVLLVLVGMVALLEAGAEEFAEGLPKTSPEGTQESLQDAVAALIGLTVDEFDEQFALTFGHFLHLRLVLVEQFFFKPLQIGLFLLLGLVGVYILIGLQ